ncbi:MAG: RecX family transcriptional regulator [Bacteroidales bacterium]|jgi:regulatory protein|nr:RecX family transcriptional regulator [Bacteroidales bacterium]
MKESEALHQAAAYCSAAEHCISEVGAKLQKWGISQPASMRIIEQLESEKFIDEKRYARNFVSDKTRFNKWGKTKITYSLQQKKIPLAIIEEALEEIDGKKYILRLSQLLRDKQKTLKGNTAYEIRTKLFRFGLSRGFSCEEIQQALDGETFDEDECT